MACMHRTCLPQRKEGKEENGNVLLLPPSFPEGRQGGGDGTGQIQVFSQLIYSPDELMNHLIQSATVFSVPYWKINWHPAPWKICFWVINDCKVNISTITKKYTLISNSCSVRLVVVRPGSIKGCKAKRRRNLFFVECAEEKKTNWWRKKRPETTFSSVVNEAVVGWNVCSPEIYFWDSVRLQKSVLCLNRKTEFVSGGVRRFWLCQDVW